jgi:hypothetical protein
MMLILRELELRKIKIPLRIRIFFKNLVSINTMMNYTRGGSIEMIYKNTLGKTNNLEYRDIPFGQDISYVNDAVRVAKLEQLKGVKQNRQLSDSEREKIGQLLDKAVENKMLARQVRDQLKVWIISSADWQEAGLSEADKAVCDGVDIFINENVLYANDFEEVLLHELAARHLGIRQKAAKDEGDVQHLAARQAEEVQLVAKRRELEQVLALVTPDSREAGKMQDDIDAIGKQLAQVRADIKQQEEAITKREAQGQPAANAEDRGYNGQDGDKKETTVSSSSMPIEVTLPEAGFVDTIKLKTEAGMSFELRKSHIDDEETKPKPVYDLWLQGKRISARAFRYYEENGFIYIDRFYIASAASRYAYTLQGIGKAILQYTKGYAQSQKKGTGIIDTANYLLMKMFYDYVSHNAQYYFMDDGVMQEKHFDNYDWIKEHGPITVSFLDAALPNLRYEVDKDTGKLKYSSALVNDGLREKADRLADSLEINIVEGRLALRYKDRPEEPLYYQVHLFRVVIKILATYEDIIFANPMSPGGVKGEGDSKTTAPDTNSDNDPSSSIEYQASSIQDQDGALTRGGIDLTNLSPSAQQSLSALRILLSSVDKDALSKLDLGKEGRAIASMLEYNVLPKEEKFRNYLLACCMQTSVNPDGKEILRPRRFASQSEAAGTQNDVARAPDDADMVSQQAIACIALALRAQEESCSPTDGFIKDALVVLESA